MEKNKHLHSIKIIQGGMGVNVSSWMLAKTVARAGQMGVVSGTAIDTVVCRNLQLGDQGGHIRRALAHFPLAKMGQRVCDRYFIEGGKEASRSFQGIGMPALKMAREKIELLVVSNFVEVFLAREGHEGIIGVNYLEKIQVTTLPSLFGAMLAGVDVVMMGAGIPLAIPGVLDDLAEWKAVSLRMHVEGSNSENPVYTHFDPKDFFTDVQPELERPGFFAIVSTDVIARQMEQKASGSVDGYVIESHTAGGHNAPPRRVRGRFEGMTPEYGEKDMPDLGKVIALGKPFWLAGRFTTRERLQEALDLGASGVQIGTPFAFCDESGINRNIKDAVIRRVRSGDFHLETSFTASPTGYPFKVVHLKGGPFTFEKVLGRRRVCDMGYLRSAYLDPNGKLGWRCPAEPVADYVAKGGKVEDTVGRFCLCNGLTATVGLGQIRRDGSTEPPILTSGEELHDLIRFLRNGKSRYTAVEVLDSILG